MKRITLSLMLMLLLAVPCFAQTAKKAPWAHQTEELLLQGSAVRDQATSAWQYDFGGGWLHYVTDKTEIGAVVSFLSQDGSTGSGAGPIYRYNLPKLKYGNLFLGGQAAVLGGDLSNEATGTAAAEFGYRLYVGQSAAVILSGKYQRAISPKVDGNTALDQAGVFLGFSVGKTPAATVQ